VFTPDNRWNRHDNPAALLSWRYVLRVAASACALAGMSVVPARTIRELRHKRAVGKNDWKLPNKKTRFPLRVKKLKSPDPIRVSLMARLAVTLPRAIPRMLPCGQIELIDIIFRPTSRIL